MNLSEFDFDLPKALIAQRPTKNREESRLMVLEKESGSIEIKRFYNIVDYFSSGDVLVLNETKVIPARLKAYKENTESGFEIFLLKRIREKTWEVLVKPGRKAKVGNLFYLDDKVHGKVLDIKEDGSRIVEFFYDGNFLEYIETIGEVPLPPYIEREFDDSDRERYQTVYASKEGAVAAPTAGLHFTDKLLKTLKDKGVIIVKVLLHVGIGTFRPVKVEKIQDHEMHSEYFEVSDETADILNNAKKKEVKIFAVGTTSVRALESSSDESGKIIAQKGNTNIFIYPGYKFRSVDAMITNFHLPKSSLMMLISAFSTLENVKKGYKRAVDESFRFFSYGDSMLII